MVNRLGQGRGEPGWDLPGEWAGRGLSTRKAAQAQGLPLVFPDISRATHTPSRVQEVTCPSPPPQTPNTPSGTSSPVSLSQ